MSQATPVELSREPSEELLIVAPFGSLTRTTVSLETALPVLATVRVVSIGRPAVTRSLAATSKVRIGARRTVWTGAAEA